jgi:hypothetical protein
MNRPLFALATVLLFAFPLAAQAAWTTNGVAVCTVDGIQAGTRVVPDGAGGAIVVWHDGRNPSDYDIYAQRLDANGNALWTGDGVPICAATGDQTDPEVIPDGAGGAIIAWPDFRSNTTIDVYAQRVNGAGAVQWTANGVAVCTFTGDQLLPVIASDGAGGAIVSWPDHRGAAYDIYAQRLNSAGAAQWTADGVAVCTAGDNQFIGSIIPSGSGGAIITWYDNRSTTNTDIYAQRLNSAGAAQWTANGVALCTAANDQELPVAISDGFDGAIVAWEDGRSGTDFDIYTQRVNKSGVVQWATNGVALCTAAGDELGPRIVTDGRYGAIVCWSDNRSATSQDIYAQRVTASGVAAWTPNGLGICIDVNTQADPAITADGADGAIIAWEDIRSGDYDIYGQRVNASGASQWVAGGIPLVTAPLQQSFTAITSDGSGAFLAWVDYRTDGNGDLYAQRISSSGSLLTGVGGATPPLDVVVGDNFPNPFSAGTRMAMTLDRAASVQVEVFDAAGHRVRAIDAGGHGAGLSELDFDGRDDHAHALPSGVYFFRVHAGAETVTKKLVIAR